MSKKKTISSKSRLDPQPAKLHRKAIANKTVTSLPRATGLNHKGTVSKKFHSKTSAASIQTVKTVSPSLPSPIQNPELEKFCAKNNIHLDDAMKIQIKTAVDKFKAGEAQLQRIQDESAQWHTHKERRRNELHHLSKAIEGLSEDTLHHLTVLGNCNSFDVTIAFDGLRLAVDNARKLEDQLPQKICNLPLRDLLTTLCSVYEQATKRKAATTKQGPFQRFCHAASSYQSGHKAIAGAVFRCRNTPRTLDERPE